MTDKLLSAYGYDLPPCSLSEQCLRLVDDLDGRDSAYWAAIGIARDDDDLALIAQLRAHLEYCPTCCEALRQARRVRTQQRDMLRSLLAEGELKVPPTTDHTLKAIRREPALAQSKPTAVRDVERAGTESVAWRTPEPGGEHDHRSSRRSSRIWQGALSLVAAALIVASMGLFSRLVLLRSNPADKAVMQPASAAQVAGWSSVAMTFVRDNSLMAVNEDPASNNSVILASGLAPDNADLDSISHDGYHLLYRIYNAQRTKTTYTFQPQAQGGKALYILSGKGGHTVWSTDDHYVFISTPQGVEQVDVRSGAAVRVILPPLQSPDIRSPIDIRFYYGGYLYFVINKKGPTDVLFRVNVAGGPPKSITVCLQSSGFWLSPSGMTIYYTCGSQNELYAVNADGSNARIVSSNAGWLIGYAADNSLLTLGQAGPRYQVVKLGATPAQDRILLDGLAPGAAYIVPGSVAVAPYGRALVAMAIYADGHEELWYGNLTNGRQSRLTIPAGAKLVALKGWDRLQVPGAGSSLPSGSQPFSDTFL